MPNTAIILFLALLIAAGFYFLGEIVRGRAERLQLATNKSGWSTEEVLKVIAAAVPILTAAIALINTIRAEPSGLQAQRDQAYAARDSAIARENEVRDSVKQVIYFGLAAWQKLPVVRLDQGTLHRLDDREARGVCSLKGTSYDATGPALIRCDPGTVLVQISKPTGLILFPDTTTRR